MTRANVTVFDGKDLTVKAYVGHDGYPESDMCMGLLNALKAGTVKDYVTSLSTEYDGTGEESAKIERCWYREPSIREGNLLDWHKKNNQWFGAYTSEDGTKHEEEIFFEEYGYEYNEKEDAITIYNYGKKKAVISKENVEAWDMLEASDIDWVIEENSSRDVWEGGIKVFAKDKNSNTVTFIINMDNSLSVQFPKYSRNVSYSDNLSKHNALNTIESIVKNHGEELSSLVKATEICDNDSISDEEKTIRLSLLYDKKPWFMAENEKGEAIRRILLM